MLVFLISLVCTRLIVVARQTWNVPGSNDIEQWSYDDLYDNEVSGARGLGIDEDMWDCHVNHYLGWWWDELAEYDLARYFIILGWSADSWDGDAPKPEEQDMSWEELTLEQRAAAAQICYTGDIWDMNPIPRWQVGTSSVSESAVDAAYASLPAKGSPTFSLTLPPGSPEPTNQPSASLVSDTMGFPDSHPPTAAPVEVPAAVPTGVPTALSTGVPTPAPTVAVEAVSHYSLPINPVTMNIPEKRYVRTCILTFLLSMSPVPTHPLALGPVQKLLRS